MRNEAFAKVSNRIRGLCKLAGSLVIAEFSHPKEGDENSGGCPVCRKNEFQLDDYGWVECTNCYEFAINQSHYERIHNTKLNNQ